MAASTVMRLQTIVSREVAPADSAVVTVGALQVGTKENIIPDEGILELNIRTFDEHVRGHVLDAVKRICRAEAEASKQKLEASGRFPRPIATQIVSAGPFYRAEEYHQRYLEKRGLENCHL